MGYINLTSSEVTAASLPGSDSDLNASHGHGASDTLRLTTVRRAE